MNKTLRFLKHILKWIGRIVLFLIGLFLLIDLVIVLIIKVPVVQQFAAQKAISFVSDKIETPLSLERLSLRFPSGVELNGLYAEDQSGDTLASIGSLSVDIWPWMLLDQHLSVRDIALENTTVKLHRNAIDSIFNFQYIIDAFAPAEPKQDTSTSQFEISLSEISLNNIRFEFIDETTQLEERASIQSLYIDVNTFSLLDQRIILEEINLDGVTNYTSVMPTESTSQPADSSTSVIPWELFPGEIKITNTQVGFKNGDEMKLAAHVGNLECQTEAFDLNQQKIHVSRLQLNQSAVSMKMKSDSAAELIVGDSSQSAPLTLPQTGWSFAINELEIFSVAFKMDQLGEPVGQGFDPAHMHLRTDSLIAEKAVFNDSIISMELDKLSARSDDQWYARNVTGDLRWVNEKMVASGFTANTPNSAVDLDAELIGNSSGIDFTDINELFIKTTFRNSKLNVRDALYFVSELETNPWYQAIENRDLQLNTKLAGSMASFEIDYLEANVENQLSLNLKGWAKQVMSPDSASGKLAIKRIYVDKQLLLAFMPSAQDSAGFQLPAFIDIKGDAQYDHRDGKVDLAVLLDSGSIDIAAELNYIDSIQSTYAANIKANEINLGYYFQTDTLGVLNFTLKGKGKGLAATNRTAHAELHLDSINFLDYTYRDLNITADLENQFAEVNTAYSDSNLIFTLYGATSLDSISPRYVVEMDLEGVDFERLNIVPYEARYSGQINAEIEIIDDSPIGILNITNFGVVRKGKEAYIDSLIFISANDTRGYNLNVNSDLITANYNGNISVLQLGDWFEHFVNHYYDMGDSTLVGGFDTARFNFTANFHRFDILNDLLIPGLYEYRPRELAASYDGATGAFEMNFDIDRLRYEKIELDSFQLSVLGTRELLSSSVRIARLAYDTLPINQVALSAELGNNILNSSLTTGPSELKDYEVSVRGESTPEGYKLSIPTNAIILNQKEWQVAEGNAVEKSKLGWRARSLTLERNQSSANIIVSRGSGEDSLIVVFDQFALSNFTGLIQTELLPAEGVVSGNLRIDSLAADLKITDLTIFDEPAGDMELVASELGDEKGYTIGAKWVGNQSQAEISGNINPTAPAEKQLNIVADFNPLSMEHLAAFSLGSVKDGNGSLKGKLVIKGSLSAPDINGELRFEDASFTVTQLESTYFMNNERIRFNKGNVEFDRFTFSDSAGNTLRLDGQMINKNYETFTLDLRLTARDFMLINSRFRGENLVEGKLITDLDTRVTGTAKAPVVRGEIKVNKGTDLQFLIPTVEAKAASSEGVVIFFDEDIESNEILGRESTSTATEGFGFEGIDLKTDVVVDDQSKLKIIIDQASGDMLYVQGGGKLALTMDPYGNTSLTGSFGVEDGQYSLSYYGLVKKEFNLEKGGRLTWTGDPINATMDLSAVYEVRADPTGLFPASSDVAGLYSGRIPFLVVINLDGELMKPEIDFDINLPADEQSAYGGRVSSKLAELNQNESELNKQVFGLLLLNSFIPEESSNGATASTAARNSASKILSNQLNKLSDQYVKGLELSVNVNSYERLNNQQSEGVTDVELGLSKQFLDNRLEVSLAGDIGVEGEEAQKQNPSDFVGDIEVSYKLTDDGRYKVRAFRENQFDQLLSEKVSETGVGIIYQRDYNELKELFRKPKPPKQEGEEESVGKNGVLKGDENEEHDDEDE